MVPTDIFACNFWMRQRNSMIFAKCNNSLLTHVVKHNYLILFVGGRQKASIFFSVASRFTYSHVEHHHIHWTWHVATQQQQPGLKSGWLCHLGNPAGMRWTWQKVREHGTIIEAGDYAGVVQSVAAVHWCDCQYRLMEASAAVCRTREWWTYWTQIQVAWTYLL